MVSKTKTKAKKKGKQTKGSKKSKPTLRKKSGIKKSNQRKTSSAVSRTRKASGKPKKTTKVTTTTNIPMSSTVGTSAQEAKLLDDENMAASSLDEDTSPQTQEESVPEVIHPVDEDIPPSTAIADEVADSDDDNTVTESI